MAVNPLTGIDAAVDRFVKFMPGQENSVHTNEVWPRLDGGPISGGFQDGSKWYKKVTVPPPVTDHRYSVNSPVGKVEADPPAAPGYPSGTWQAVHTLVLRPLEELIAQIETQYQLEVAKRLPATQDRPVISLAAKAMIKKIQGGVLTDAEQALLDTATLNGDGVAQLVARRDELIAAATANEDYDITDWPDVSAP